MTTATTHEDPAAFVREHSGAEVPAWWERAMADACEKSPALRYGSTEIVHAEGALLVMRCQAGDAVADIAINSGIDTITFDLEDTERPLLAPIALAGDTAIDGHTVALGPSSGAILRRGARPVDAEARRLPIIENARLRDADFRVSAVSTRARPTRFDFAITERCDMRCRHCIAGAPERTADGSARVLSPSLLDRLRDDLAFAEYAGFTHGGEPLAEPMLFEVLSALRAARAGERTVTHVLTNGMLLDARMLNRLLAAGVSSIAISLDGATAATNDAIREGGQFDRIVENLRGAAQSSRYLGADLRLGVACVVMGGNANELSALVDLAADAGASFIQFDEVVPINAFAERSLVRLDAGAVRDALENAVERAASRGLVAVDRACSPIVWRCRLGDDPAAARALLALEFAARGDVHPCRAAWEHACVAPNGDVLLADFFGPVIGNLEGESLPEMWNSRAAQMERQRAIRGRLCGGGPLTCLGVTT